MRGFLLISIILIMGNGGLLSQTVVNQQKDPFILGLMEQMSIEEKVGQMIQVTLDVITKGPDVYSSFEPLELDRKALRELLVDYHAGSVINTANNRARSPELWNNIITRIQNVATDETRFSIPVLYGVDAIHGATYTDGATMFPQQINLAASWNPGLVKNAAEIAAYETRASGIPWNFSPVLDLGQDPRWPRFWETFGEDPFLAATMGVAMTDGYEGLHNNIGKNHVASCLKHFIGYSVPVSGKDRTPAVITNHELREKHLPVFKAAIDAGAHSIMINSGIVNGIPVHGNHDIITGLLKEELGFTGLVVTDWADIENLHKRDRIAADMKEAIRIAVNAGIDMSMIPYNYQEFSNLLVELVKEGEVSEERINDAVYRVLWLKKETGLFDQPVTTIEDYPDFGSEKHEKVAYQLAAESITLLKNENGILPLKGDEKILLCGPNANSMRALNGGWTYSWQGDLTDEFAGGHNTILEAMQSRAGADKIVYMPGVIYEEKGNYHDEKIAGIKELKDKSRDVDLIMLCLGENSYTEKMGDLNDLNLSINQSQLAAAAVATGKPVVLVLNSGRPRLITSFAQDMKAILNIYLPGNFGADALADILYGDLNPGGKLPYTYPAYPNSLTGYIRKPSESGVKMDGVYDYSGSFNPLFEFGHGLSYSEFRYSDIMTDKSELYDNDSVKLVVRLENISEVKGTEVVQVYVSDLYASMTPDVKRLRAFNKLELEPGEEKELVFYLSAEAFSYVNLEGDKIVEAGEFQISVNGMSRSLNVPESFYITDEK